jgi:hypothetical protein
MNIRSVSLAASLLVVFATGSIARNSHDSQQSPASQAPPSGRASAAPTPACGPNLAAQVKNVADNSRCFELRTYTVQPGSSIDLLHSRFRDHTTALFMKHGMTIIGYWQPLTKPNVLVYMLAYKDAAARDASWAAFNADPEWVKTRTAMQVNLQVDNLFMSATDYSPMK